MAVRFLPPPEERQAGVPEERGDLAEVIELRSTLAQWAPAPSVSDESDVPETFEVPDESDELATSDEHAESDALASAAQLRELMHAADACVGESDDDAVRVSPETGRTCTEDGVRLLARRAKSSGELREALLKLSHDSHDVETVIEEFERSHYLDDAGLARLLTEKLRDTKGASRSQIRMKLRERKLPDLHIETAIGELDVEEEYALLRDAAENRASKLVGLDRQTAERRLLGFLARRGWSGEPAMRAARDALDGQGGSHVGRTRSGTSSGVRFTP